MTASLALSTKYLSSPLPPAALSLPTPPSSVSSPRPPLSASLSAPPSTTSLPAPPSTMSFPSLPSMNSSRSVPVSLSLPAVPMMMAIWISTALRSMGEMPVRAFHGPDRARAAIQQWGGQAKYARETDRPLQNVTDYPLCLRDLLAVPKDYCGTATFTCDLLHRLRCKH